VAYLRDQRESVIGLLCGPEDARQISLFLATVFAYDGNQNGSCTGQPLIGKSRGRHRLIATRFTSERHIYPVRAKASAKGETGLLVH